MPCKPGVAGSIPGFSITLSVEPSGGSRHIINTQIINPPGPVLVSTHGKATKSFFFFFFWYYIHPSMPVEKLCASETVKCAFKKVGQLRLFKGASLRVGVALPQILWSIDTCINLTCICDSFNRQGFRG